MAYSNFEQRTMDLDLYFRDSSKNVHIASGGGLIPDFINQIEAEIEAFKDEVENIEQTFEVSINPNLRELLDLEEDGYEDYISSFVFNAKKGFFSYDKSRLGDFENVLFHLVAYPNINSESPAIEFMNMPQLSFVNLSLEMDSFNLNESITNDLSNFEN